MHKLLQKSYEPSKNKKKQHCQDTKWSKELNTNITHIITIRETNSYWYVKGANEKGRQHVRTDE